ncbi:MAG: hypothetical protein J5826_09045 [Bacteroidales bacterium]|nr:hypothetical protein [Bacteroidales bacterium]
MNIEPFKYAFITCLGINELSLYIWNKRSYGNINLILRQILGEPMLPSLIDV